MLTGELTRSARGALAAALSAAAVLTPWPDHLAALRVPFALALVLYLPGACVLMAAFPERAATVEVRVLAVALSLALTMLSGLGLHLVGALTARGWTVVLSGVPLAACAAAALTRCAAGLMLRTGPPPPLALRAPRPPRRSQALAAAVLVASVALAAAAVASAEGGARAHREYRFTEFWLVPQPGQPTAATLGLRNAEQVRASYEVDVVIARDVVARWPAIALAPGETRTVEFAAPPGSTGRRVEAWLYKDGNRSVVYRKVWMVVPGPVRSLAAGE